MKPPCLFEWEEVESRYLSPCSSCGKSDMPMVGFRLESMGDLWLLDKDCWEDFWYNMDTVPEYFSGPKECRLCDIHGLIKPLDNTNKRCYYEGKETK